MLRYLIYISVGYLIFKVVKNGVYLAIENFQKPKELKDTTVLIQCEQCGGFFDPGIRIHYDEKSFCSETCREDFISELI